VSGYFDFDHLEDLARHAMEWTGKAEGCYVTINPVKPDLLARASNRVIKKPRHTTTDADIVRRVGIVFDADPQRSAGISATDEEKALARERIARLVSHLAALGWPDPVLADSGNGFHAYYKIDLPADDGGLVERVLKAAAARFSDGLVEIDVKVANPSRIIKLYGTKSRKGDSTPDRPHRWTRVLSVPAEFRVVPVELLEAFAAEAAPAHPGPKSRGNGQLRGHPQTQAGNRSSPEARAQAYVFATGFPDSIAGQHGHGRLYHVACELIDGFGLTEDQAMPILRDWNERKAKPPESEKQVRHKLAQAIKNHPAPSLKRLNATRDDGTATGPARALGKPRTHGDTPPGEAGSPVAPEEWPPLRLSECPPVLPFPVDVLPRSVADFVRNVAASIGCPEDFVGLPVIIAAGAAIGRSVSLRLRPNHFASASLYGMNVGSPSSGKSPALDFVVRPFWDLNQSLLDAYRTEKEKYDQAVESRKSAGGDKKTPAPQKPVPKAAVVDDITVEANARAMENNPRGLLMVRDEGVALVRSLNQYKAGGKGSDLEFYLTVLMGKPVRVDRKGHPDGLPIMISHPFLGIIGNVPPDLLCEFREKRGLNDGCIERFLWACPDPKPRPHWSTKGVDDWTLKTWAKIVEGLRAIKMVLKDGSKPCPNTISFTPEAERLWESWYNSHADEVNSPGFDDDALAGEIKLVDFAGRFVLILQMLVLVCDPGFKAGEPIPPVPPSAVQGAIRLWEYFRSHQSRVRWHLSGGVGHRHAARIVRRLKANRIDQFTLKTLNDHIRHQERANEDALAWLGDQGIVRPLAGADRPPGTRGRKPSPAYEVNPELHDLSSRFTHNSLNSPPEGCQPPSAPAQGEFCEKNENREVDSQDAVDSRNGTAPPELEADDDAEPGWFADSADDEEDARWEY
jgi:hypothetical protein